jgi:hypothetical protein
MDLSRKSDKKIDFSFLSISVDQFDRCVRLQKREKATGRKKEREAKKF